ncbi:Anoctamin-7 [Dinochytrium kinnereticum]|nr:Anoctamin-7 [Dinochytrium kinnereticum]
MSSPTPPVVDRRQRPSKDPSSSSPPHADNTRIRSSGGLLELPTTSVHNRSPTSSLLTLTLPTDIQDFFLIAPLEETSPSSSIRLDDLKGRKPSPRGAGGRLGLSLSIDTKRDGREFANNVLDPAEVVRANRNQPTHSEPVDRILETEPTDSTRKISIKGNNAVHFKTPSMQRTAALSSPPDEKKTGLGSNVTIATFTSTPGPSRFRLQPQTPQLLSPSTSIRTTVDFPRDLVIGDFEECLIIEREAFGDDPDSFYARVYGEEKKDDAVHVGEDEGGRVLTRRYGRGLVHFLYKKDLDLFDEVVGFKEIHPEVDRRAAHEFFCGRGHADAMVKIVYADNDTHWDAILKYTIDPKIAEDSELGETSTDASSDATPRQNQYPTSAAAAAASNRLHHHSAPEIATSSSWNSWKITRRSAGLVDEEMGDEIWDEEIWRERASRANYERELLRHHLILVRERGVDIDVKIGRNVTRRVHFVKVMASFDTLCLEAERIKLKMDVSERHTRVREHFYKRIANAKGADEYHMNSHQKRQLRDVAQAAAEDSINRSTAPPGDGGAMRNFSSRAGSSHGVFRHHHNPATPTAFSSVSGITPFKRLNPKQFREGPDGTIIGTLRFIFSLVPHSIDLESDAFDRDRLSEFRGGDAALLGKTTSQVALDFFPNSKRNLLVHIISQRCKIHQKTGRAYNIGINHLLLEKVYTDFYAVHDGPYRILHSQRITTKTSSSPTAQLSNSPTSAPSTASPSCPPPPEHPSRENERAWLFENWARFRLSWSQVLLEQPLRQIRDYFGERIAYYFTWLGFYTLWLWIPAAVGFIVFLYGIRNYVIFADVFDNALTTPFAFFMAVWAALFLEFWKRQEATLNTVWDVLDVEMVETRRPEWYGTHLRRSPVTGKIELHFPKHIEIVIRILTTGILFFAILLMVAFEVIVILTHAAALNLRSTLVSSTNVASLVAGVLTLFNIIFLTPIYLKLSYMLNGWENHRTLEKFDNALIFKSFVVSFVNNYSTLTYVGIIKVFVGRNLPGGLRADTCDPLLDDPTNPYASCMSQLMLNMLVIFVGLQFFNQIRLVAVPLIRQTFRRYLRASQKADTEYARHAHHRNRGRRGPGSTTATLMPLPQYVQDDLLDTWHQREEFTAKMVQFGFIALFSCGFPLAPFFALVNNAIEIRFGAFRLVAESRRPFIRRAQGFAIDWLVPDVPGKVKHAIERQKYLARVESGAEIEDEDEVSEADLGIKVE